MHPDLYAVVFQQRERELETELRRRLIRQERGDATPVARRDFLEVVARLRTKVGRIREAASVQTAPACCPA